jgi:uncharacterized protein YbjQ (UPF0145 family)
MTLSSCSYYTYCYQSGSTSFAETNPDSIKIYSGDTNQEYIVIGSVTVDVAGGTKVANKYLKKKASKLGADAIIKVELTKLNTYADRVGISGVAIKYK